MKILNVETLIVLIYVVPMLICLINMGLYVKNYSRQITRGEFLWEVVKCVTPILNLFFGIILLLVYVVGSLEWFGDWLKEPLRKHKD